MAKSPPTHQKNVNEPRRDGADADVEPLIDEVLDLYEAAGRSRLAGLKGVLAIEPENHEAWIERLQSMADKMRARSGSPKSAP